MDYEALAIQLLNVRTDLHQDPAHQQISKMLQGELFVLNYLVTHEKIIHPRELSRTMSVSTARIASLLNHMEEKGLVHRTADPGDSRQVIVRLTGAGRDAIEKTRVEVIRYAASMLERLGPEDAAEYIRIQEKICVNLRSGE